MRALVTGGAGFIGSNLCKNLLRKGHEVVCFDNLSTGKPGNIAEFKQNSNFSFIKGDANNIDDLKKAFSKYNFDWVFHYAAIVGVERTLENPDLVLKDEEGIKNILELSRKNNVKKVLFSSSSEIYGEPEKLPEKEDESVDPKLPYAVVKLKGEELMKAYFRDYGLKTCSLRFFNVYGPKQDSTPYGFVVGIFIKQVLQDKNPIIFGTGEQTRDFVFIDDNIEASIRAMETEKSNGEVINIGTGKPTRIIELANTIIKLCCKEKKLKPEFMEARKKEIMHRCSDISKMKELIGYKAKFDLDTGLKKTIEWYKARS